MNGSLTITLRRCIYAVLFFIEKIVVFCGGLRQPRIILLTYHSISSDEWRFSVSKEAFKEQITWLQKQGFEFLTIQQVYEIIDGRRKLSKKSVSIMFDDGYQDILAVKEWLQLQCISPFVCVLSNPDNAVKTEICPSKSLLTTEDLRVLRDDGWLIGSHSATHADFSNMPEEDARGEIIESKKELELVLGEKVNWFVYPKGYYSEMIVQFVKDAGYRMAFSMDDGNVIDALDRFTIPRIGVDRSHNLTDFRGMISPLAVVFRGMIKKCVPQRLINRMLGIRVSK